MHRLRDARQMGIRASHPHLETRLTGEAVMTQIAWKAFSQEMGGTGGQHWLLAEIEERLRLGDSLVVTEIPPDGDTLAFDDPQEFRCWASTFTREN